MTEREAIAKRWHAKIMYETQFCRMHRKEPPTIWISEDLLDLLFDSLVCGGHLLERYEGVTYFGCPCKIVSGHVWDGVHYIVGYEGGEQ